MQVYSKLHYEKRLKPIINEKWAQYIANNPDMERKKGEALRHRNAVTKELYDGETDEFKAAIEKKREEGDYERIEPGPGGDAVEKIERQRCAKLVGIQKKVFLHFSKQSFLTNTTF
jgi:hypothetical protein